MPFEIVDVRSRLALLREISYPGSSAEVETELTVELVEYCRRREAQGWRLRIVIRKRPLLR